MRVALTLLWGITKLAGFILVCALFVPIMLFCISMETIYDLGKGTSE